MAKQYHHFTIEEREKIQQGIWEKQSIRKIADELRRSPSSVSRELQKNFPAERKKYTPRLADERADVIRHQRNKKPRLKNDFTRNYVKEKLKTHWSPEQISGRLKLEYPEYAVSHEAIYQYIYAQWHRGGNGALIGEDFTKYLRRRHKRRKRMNVLFKTKKTMINGRIGIEQRPKYINLRKKVGHWEGDSMESCKRGSGEMLNTLVERKIGIVLISRIKSKLPQETAKIVSGRLEKLPPKLRKTITLDNGLENKNHQDITKEIGAKCYFANPYRSWERGTNENTNGLIRQYLPKGIDFATVSNEYIIEVENALNNRPRKRLKYKTPLEALEEVLH